MAYKSIEELDLIKRQQEKENEIEQIYKILTDVKFKGSLVHGRDYWLQLYNRKKAEYEAFCIKNKSRRRTLFSKITN